MVLLEERVDWKDTGPKQELVDGSGRMKWQAGRERSISVMGGGEDMTGSQRERKRESVLYLEKGVYGREWKVGFQARLELQEIIYEPEQDDASAAYDEKSVCVCVWACVCTELVYEHYYSDRSQGAEGRYLRHNHAQTHTHTHKPVVRLLMIYHNLTQKREEWSRDSLGQSWVLPLCLRMTTPSAYTQCQTQIYS